MVIADHHDLANVRDPGGRNRSTNGEGNMTAATTGGVEVNLLDLFQNSRD